MKLPFKQRRAKDTECETCRYLVGQVDQLWQLARATAEQTDEDRANQKKANECFTNRQVLSEAALAGLLADRVGHVVGADYYLEELRKIRESDPGSFKRLGQLVPKRSGSDDPPVEH